MRYVVGFSVGGHSRWASSAAFLGTFGAGEQGSAPLPNRDRREVRSGAATEPHDDHSHPQRG